MVPIDLLNERFPEIFNLKKKESKQAISAKCNAAKHNKISVVTFFLLTLQSVWNGKAGALPLLTS